MWKLGYITSYKIYIKKPGIYCMPKYKMVWAAVKSNKQDSKRWRMSQLRRLLCHKFLSYGVLRKLPSFKTVFLDHRLENLRHRYLYRTGECPGQLVTYMGWITFSEESWRAEKGWQNWHSSTFTGKSKYFYKNAV